MLELFTPGNLFTLLMLVLLQAVLGFDNLLYISIESKRVAADRQSYVRKLGIGFAIVLRILLLIVILFAIERLQTPFFTTGIEQTTATAVQSPAGDAAGSVSVQRDEHQHAQGAWRLTGNGRYFAGSFNVHSVIVLLGGFFIIYTAFKEIFHMLGVEHIEHGNDDGANKRSVAAAVFWIMTMNLVFSFDSILSAIALTDNIPVMALAIVISGVMMMVMADHVAEFLKKNRMYEVLGLFILLIVGVMLVTEGGHLAHLHFFGHEITAMNKSTFYFVIGVMVVVDIVQGRYQKKLLAQRARETGENPAT